MSSTDSVLTKADVYQALVDLSEPLKSLGPWRKLSQKVRFRQVPADPSSLLTTLRERFSAELLRSAGVIKQDANGNEQLVPALSQPGALLLPLFGKEGEKPYDILSENGCLSGRLPVLAVLEDERFVPARQSGQQTLWLAFSMADVAVLWSLGLPATLARGLQNLRGLNVQKFCKKFGFTLDQTHFSGPPPARHGPHLKIVAWSPAKIAQGDPEALNALRRHFGKLQQYLHYDFEELEVWSPSRENFGALRFCRDSGTPQDYLRVFRRSRRSDLIPLLWTPAESSRPTENFAEAQSRFLAAYEQRADEGELQKAQQEFRRLLKRDVINPLQHAAEDTACPLTAGAFRLAATQAQLSLLLAHQITRRGIECDDRKPDPYLQQLLALVKSYMAIYRELQQQENKKKKPPRAAASPSPGSTPIAEPAEPEWETVRPAG